MNKKAIVTGASGGIGSAVARRLCADGWNLTLCYHNGAERARALAEELGCSALRADVSKPDEAEALLRQTGPVGLLVCCAGVAFYGLLTDHRPEDWRRLFAVNADGVYNCCRAVIPGMVHEKAGCILTMSSVWGVHGASCEAGYAASKGAVIALSRSLAKELGPSGIRVNCIAPGVIETEMLARFSPEEKAALAEETPLGRLGTPEDVAELAAFLASVRASFLTGQVIGCDGGFGA